MFYEILMFIVEVIVLLIFLTFLSLLVEWFRRKIEARMQNRMGPTYTGYGGILQPLADFIKLLSKEDIELKYADNSAIGISILSSLIVFTVSLFFTPIVGRTALSFEGDIIVLMLLVALGTVLLYVAGWACHNVFSIIGAIRLMAIILAFDIPLFIVSIIPAILTNTFTVNVIAYRIFNVYLMTPLVIPIIIAAFLIFIFQFKQK